MMDDGVKSRLIDNIGARSETRQHPRKSPPMFRMCGLRTLRRGAPVRKYDK